MTSAINLTLVDSIEYIFATNFIWLLTSGVREAGTGIFETCNTHTYKHTHYTIAITILTQKAHFIGTSYQVSLVDEDTENSGAPNVCTTPGQRHTAHYRASH